MARSLDMVICACDRDHATSYAGTDQGRTGYDLNTHATKPVQVEGPAGEELLTQAISFENKMGPRGKKKELSGAQSCLPPPNRAAPWNHIIPIRLPPRLLLLHPGHISSQEASAHRQRDCLITLSCGSEFRFIFPTHPGICI